MQLKRKCCVCKKELRELEGHSETVTHPGFPGYNLPSGGVILYCDKCFYEKMNGYKEMETASDDTRIQQVMDFVKEKLLDDVKEIIILKDKDRYKIRYR